MIHIRTQADRDEHYHNLELPPDPLDTGPIDSERLSTTAELVESLTEQLFTAAMEYYRSGGGMKGRIKVPELPEGIGIMTVSEGIRNLATYQANLQRYDAFVSVSQANIFFEIHITKRR